MKKDLLDMTIEEMQEFAVSLGEKPYRGRQLFQWVWGDKADAKATELGETVGLSNSRDRLRDLLDVATDLPKGFREKVAEAGTLDHVTVVDMQVDENDGTRKFLFGLGDTGDGEEQCPGNEEKGETRCVETVEGVFMKYRYGNTLCVSSQIGCKMGRTFCASALGGFVRDLTAGEMTGQIVAAEEAVGERIDHIVVMGMGEPFDNYGNLARFLNIIHDPTGRKMSWRNMTVSTSGVIPGIVAFSQDFPQVNLAISLHRAEDVERSRLMPVNRRYPLGELIEAAREHGSKTHRRTTFEYALIAGENDGDEDAERLIRLLRGMLCHVNLISLNEVDEIGLKGSDRARAEAFMERLEAGGIPTTLRRKLGSSIDGACGQLRLRSRQA